MASPVMHVKLSIRNGKGVAVEMRRFAMPAETTLEELQRAVQSMTKSTEEVRLTYQDNDGDMVTLGSVWEWEECQRVGGSYCDPRTPLRLYVHKRHQKRKCGGGVEEETRAASACSGGAAADGAGVTSGEEGEGEEYFYHSDGAAQSHDAARLDEMKTTVKGVLAGYTNGGSLPEFLREAIRTCEDGLDVNINGVAEALSRQGLVEMSNEEYGAALKHLQDSFVLKPTYVTRYNIGCCYAQQGMAEQAVEALRNAVEMGYVNAAHMRMDEDLVSLHGNPQFVELLGLMEAATAATPPTPTTTGPTTTTTPAEDRAVVREESVDVVELEDDDDDFVEVVTAPPQVQTPETPSVPAGEPVPAVAYPQELERLMEMGFSVADASGALEITGGDYRAAVGVLLGMQ